MDNQDDCNLRCVECKHDDWIRAWQEKERRKEEIFQTVKANVLTWIAMGAIGYFGLLLFDAVKNQIKGV